MAPRRNSRDGGVPLRNDPPPILPDERNAKHVRILLETQGNHELISHAPNTEQRSARDFSRTRTFRDTWDWWFRPHKRDQADERVIIDVPRHCEGPRDVALAYDLNELAGRWNVSVVFSAFHFPI